MTPTTRQTKRGEKSTKVVGERALIGGIRQRAKSLLLESQTRRRPGILHLGIGDDCAILRPRRGEDLLVTTDLSLENVHFRRDWHPPQSVGHRCLARGLSDLAAMGARPESAFLSLALPGNLPEAWLDGFLDGLLALAKRCRVPLAGGDTAKAGMAAGEEGLVVADIVLVGSLPTGRSLLRSGARARDIIYVTGALGGSAAELKALAASPRTFQQAAVPGHPHLYPEPRLAVGRKLMQKRIATAAIDLSDGLSTDLGHLCAESGLSAEIDEDSLPVDARATLQQALHGGEDYELLFTARPGTRVPKQIAGAAVHAIGVMQKPRKGTPQIQLRQQGKLEALAPQGWEHFRST